LKSTQFRVLQAISDAGEIAHCDLAAQSAASEETFSRRLASARRNGWVEMRIGERQRRIYVLTDEGRRVLRAAMPFWQRAQDRLAGQLGGDWRDLMAFADRLTRAALDAEIAPARNGSERGSAPKTHPPQPGRA
jgi:DNA-binding MarR family transcriptional regulator